MAKIVNLTAMSRPVGWVKPTIAGGGFHRPMLAVQQALEPPDNGDTLSPRTLTRSFAHLSVSASYLLDIFILFNLGETVSVRLG